MNFLVMTAVASWCAAAPVAAVEPTARLSGVVTSEGRPLADATVMVYQAWPLEGLAYYCPGCYRDCGKSVVTGGDGTWAIEKLDDSLKFELLVVAKDHLPQQTGVLKPATSGVVQTALTARDLGALASEQVVRGRIVNEDGEPIKGAVVNPDMVMWDGGGCGGACAGLDELAVTDAEGRFALAYAKPCVSMDLKVSGRGYAPTCFPSRRSGVTEHVLTVKEGASVGGRLVRDGEAVPDVEITLSADQSGRRVCFDRQTIATDKDGRFLFTGVLPGQRYFVVASTDQLMRGCTAPKGFEVSTEGEEVDVGDLAAIKGVRVAGRVLGPEGGELPAGAKLSISSRTGWDGVTVDLGADGSFAFPEVAPGEYSISLVAPGVYVSHRNASADKLNLNNLIGTIAHDIDGLEIETTLVRPQKPSRVRNGPAPELGGIERGH